MSFNQGFSIKRFFIRLHRRNTKHCVYCGRKISKGEWFCSIECACYDGSYSCRTGWLKKPSLLRGRVGKPKERGWL